MLVLYVNSWTSSVYVCVCARVSEVVNLRPDYSFHRTKYTA